jgi:hypothetical protein
MGRVLATDKELIFDLKVQAENANAWTVQINECDLSVFAFSQIVPNSIVSNETELAEYIHHYNITKHSNMTVEAISSLGNIYIYTM